LQQQGYQCAYVRALGKPLTTIRDDVCRVLKLECAEGKTLRDFFRNALGSKGRLVVILDQFEQFLTLATKPTRRQFWRELSDCLGMTDPQVRFILSLREEHLGKLDEARHTLDREAPTPLPNILRDSYRLTSLTADGAHQAIVVPARHAQCTIESQLIDLLVGDHSIADLPHTGPHEGSLKEPDGSVPPPSLQIVMDRLYQSALVESGHQPPPRDRNNRWQPPALQIGLAAYEKLGGAAGILADYVKAALDRVPEHGGDRKLAETLLKVMVTSKAEKAALDAREMAAEVSKTDPDGKTPESLEATRKALVDLRLVRSFQVGERTLYELVHDHMAKEIATWMDEGEMMAKLAYEQLCREVDARRHDRSLIELNTLEWFHSARESLRLLDPEQLELLFRSALGASREIAHYWTERAKGRDLDLEQIIRDDLGSGDWNQRASIAEKLNKIKERAFVSPLCDLLRDPFPQVRVAAIYTLQGYRDPEARQALLDNLAYEVYVPGGRFVIGDDDSDENNDKPQRDVYLDAFYAARYPVTNREYKRFADARGRALEFAEDKADHPVTGISWYEAVEYARWANMRLLNEAEWEKAASWDERSGTKRPFPWGDTFDETRCNTRESGSGGTTPVGVYSERGGDSPYGCADMAGNVWEWTSSLYVSYPYRPKAGREDEQAQGDRVLRGGSFFLDGALSRTAYRSSRAPDRVAKNIGFRLGLDAVPPHANAR
jgi:formylglycine-generating enzyme required for sulfatase activity